ncbi:MAG: hypothetical protein EYC62_06400 [Alphaproteobacteria bacterium]|nr:MAG: hypothetical protein EYC62_06400 [Alphaproteobacteria bacterium]
MIIRNTDGLTAIGNRYFGSKNAADVARAYSRAAAKESAIEQEIYAGNRQSDRLQVVQNGLVEKTYETLPKPSLDSYATARNILDRVATIAQTVVDEGDNLSDNQRALYDAEFQYLRQQLIDHNIGSNPTVAGASNPAGARLENLNLINSNDELSSVDAAGKVIAHVQLAQQAIDLQEGGYQAAQLEQISTARDTYYDYQQGFSSQADTIDQLRSDFARTQIDPAAQLVARYNPRIEQNVNRSSILNLLA